jgi:hypothetical protein
MESLRTKLLITGTPAWIVKLVKYLLRLQTRKPVLGIGTTFDIRKAVAEIVVIAVVFYSLVGAPWMTVAAIVTVGFITLRIRDLLIHPAQGTVDETATDALVMAAAVAMSQAYFTVKLPAAAMLPTIALLQGIGLSMLGVAGVRQFCHGLTPNNDPQQRPEFRVFSAALRINMMFGLAYSLPFMSNVEAVRGGDIRDFVLPAVALISFRITHRLQQETDRSAIFENLAEYTLFIDPAKLEAAAKADSLPKPPNGLPKTWPVACFNAVFVASTLSLLGIASWRWVVGDGASVHWGQLAANFIGLAIMMPAWKIITHLNKAVADLLKQSAKPADLI